MIRDRLRTAVVGVGYVGIETAVGLAGQDRDSLLAKQDPDRLAPLSPFGGELDHLAPRGDAAVEPLTVASSLGSTFVCPVCREVLSVDPAAYMCPRCRRSFPVVDGIPILLPVATLSAHDEIDHAHGGYDHDARGDSHKAAHAEYFARAVAEEFEITRPHGSPRLYRFFLHEKFRRATAPIGPRLVGATALTVCGGSGMDAEFLERAGARVVASDLSLGAAQRTRERARRYGLNLMQIVADVEQLPFADDTFDLVLVHDGLHHLERPEAALAEMARVARHWVSVSEPAKAAATAVAVRVGVALDREEAGNQVVRLALSDVVDALGTAGFSPLRAQRYAMYYRHVPGSIFRIFSVRALFPLFRAGWRAGNALLGRVGNKLVVVAERQDEPREPSLPARDRRSGPAR